MRVYFGNYGKKLKMYIQTHAYMEIPGRQNETQDDILSKPTGQIITEEVQEPKHENRTRRIDKLVTYKLENVVCMPLMSDAPKIFVSVFTP